MPKSIALILKGYPRLSETFITEEIHALEQAGIAITIFSLRHPTDKKTHALHQAIRARVVYLPEYLHRQPLRVFRAWWKMRRRPHYQQARKIWLRDLRRDFTRNRIRRFGQALVLANELPAEITLLYAHFLHTPASVTSYASILQQLPWSCSAHAKDIWTLSDWEKVEKLERCEWLTTCTRANLEHLRQLTNSPNKVTLNYHGLALSRFPDAPPQHSQRDGSDAEHPVRLVSIGRAVAKKGYPGLLNALASLPQNLHWELTHIGTGPLLAEYQQQAINLGVENKINWLGAQSHQTVIDCYRNSDLFVLNCRIDTDGDRDGLPNVLVEAQSQGLAAISTRISGIPELIEHGVNGLLVEENDDRALADALGELISDYELRNRLGDAGKTRVFAEFDMQHNFANLHRLVAGDSLVK